MNDASTVYPGLNNAVNLSVNNYTIEEVIRAIAIENGLNVVVDPALTETPTYNFSNASVKEVFLLLCKNHNLDITWTGSIMSFNKVVDAPPVKLAAAPKEINIRYDSASALVSADLEGDTLYDILKQLTIQSGVNIYLQPSLHDKIVKVHFLSLPFEDALKSIIGEEEWVKVSDNFYKVNSKKADIADGAKKSDNGKNGHNTGSQAHQKSSNDKDNKDGGDEGAVSVEVLPNGRITVSAEDASISDIIKMISSRVGVNYHMFKEPTDKTTVNIVEKDYEEILKILFNASNFTYSEMNGVFLIGDRSQEGLRTTRVVQLQHRTAHDAKEFIPADLKKSVEVILFPDQNSLVLSGSDPQIKLMEDFLKQIDKVVPVVLIEVIILDVSKTYSTKTGLTAGQKSSQTVSPTNNYSLDPTTGVGATVDGNLINQLLQSFNGFGILNLGQVSANFFVTLQAMETNGYVKKRSTPKLSTLNGHEASMSIGSTAYYLEQATNIIGAQSPQTQITNVYKPVNADLTLKIKPVVSGDNQITLEIEVQQSDFTTAKIAPTAPPENTKKKFQSMIRVKDQEMVILGGLELDSKSESGSGVPFLSRIPIIKWFFSSRSKATEKDKLIILVKATVIY